MNTAAAIQLGMEHLTAGRLAEAEAQFRQVLSVEPSNVNALQLLGLAAHRQGRFAEAIELIGRAIRLAPKSAELHHNLAEALRMSGEREAAIAEYESAIALKPALLAARISLGQLLNAAGRFDEAAELLAEAVRFSPGSVEAQVALANVLMAQGQTAQAAEVYRDLLNQRGDEAVIWFNYANALRQLGQLDESIAASRRGLELQPDSAAGHSALLLTLHYPGDIPPQTIFAEHRAWAQRHADHLAADARTFAPHVRDAGQRLRIGYVSPDFRDHVVARFIEPAMALHDRERFEVFCYADERRSDEVTRRLKTYASTWRNVTALSDEKLAAQIRDDRIDILIDLAGHTAHNRLLASARRPAPVQMTYLGYPNTTGMAAMDWRITDALADPPGMTESLHTEQLLRLPCAWCYQPPADAPEPSPREPGGVITFGCFNALPKISRRTLDLWADVLKAVRRSRLLLKSTAFADAASRQRYLDAFASRGIDPVRNDLAGPTATFAEHLTMYDRIDVLLDTFPYAGTTTTCEALWMGVPVVTLAGETHVSRVGVSLLSNAGAAEWIAATADDYVRLATDLAERGIARSELRERVRASRLLDARRFVIDLEATYLSVAQQTGRD